MVSLATWRRDLNLDALEDEQKLPRGLLTSVMRHESAGDPNATSRVGAGGLFQLMPPTAAQYGADPYNPQQASRAAARELGSHYKRYEGDLQQTLAAWNWGSGNVQRKGMANMPAETRAFIRHVSSGMGEQYAAAGDTTLTDTGRGKVTGPSKKAPSWTDAIPDELPSPAGGQALVAPEPGRTAPKAPAWTDAIPDELPGAPTASPVPSAAQTAPQTPPAPGVAPGAFQAPQRAPAPEQWAIQQAPAQVAQMGPGPYVPSGLPPEQQTMSERLAAHEAGQNPNAPPGPSLLQQGATAVAQQVNPPAPPQTQTPEERKAQALASVDRLQAQQPGGMFGDYDPSRARKAVSGALETGADIVAGTTGAIVGGRIAGGPGVVAGPVIAQGLLDRARMQLGLKPQEKPVWETGIVDLYQADLLNAGFGLLLGIPDLARSALRHTSAGKAILAADDAAKAAADAYEASEKDALETFQKGQAFNRESHAMSRANARERYDARVKERNDLITKNQETYDKAVQEYQTRKLQRDAEVQDVDAANYYNEQRYQQQTADLPAQQQAADAAAEQKVLDVAAQREAAQEQTYQAQVAQSQADTAAHGEAVERVTMLPEIYKESGDTASVKYGRVMDEVKDEWVSPLEGQAQLKKFREEDYAQLLDDANMPMPPEVEMHAKRLEAMKAGEPVSVKGVWDAMKKLGPLTRSPNGDIRRTASALYGIYSDMLEQAPDIAAAIKDANRTFKREQAVKEMATWSQGGAGSFVKRDAQNRLQLNTKAMFDRLDTLERNKLFRGAFSDEEWAALRKDVGEFANTPALGKDVTRPEPVALGEPAYTTLPEPTREPVIGQPKALGPEPTLRQEKPIGPFPEVPFERTRAGRKTYEPEAPPKTQEQMRAEAKMEPRKLLRPGAGQLAQIGGIAYMLQRAGLTPGMVDTAIWGTLIGVGATALTRGAERHILSEMLMTPTGRRLLQYGIDRQGVVNPLVYRAYLSTMTMAERKALQRDLPTEPEEKGGRRGATR